MICVLVKGVDQCEDVPEPETKVIAESEPESDNLIGNPADTINKSGINLILTCRWYNQPFYARVKEMLGHKIKSFRCRAPFLISFYPVILNCEFIHPHYQIIGQLLDLTGHIIKLFYRCKLLFGRGGYLLRRCGHLLGYG